MRHAGRAIQFFDWKQIISVSHAATKRMATHYLTLVVVAASSLGSLVGCSDATSVASPTASDAIQSDGASGDPVADASTSSGSGDGGSAGRSAAIVDKTFDDIKFEMEVGEAFEQAMLTPEIEALFDRKIRIRGYMYPTFQQRGLKQFVLVRDNMECCFGPGAALFDCILVKMNEGKTADFSVRPVAVEGTFRFEEFIDPLNGSHLAIYKLEGETVR